MSPNPSCTLVCFTTWSINLPCSLSNPSSLLPALESCNPVLWVYHTSFSIWSKANHTYSRQYRVICNGQYRVACIRQYRVLINGQQRVILEQYRVVTNWQHRVTGYGQYRVYFHHQHRVGGKRQHRVYNSWQHSIHIIKTLYCQPSMEWWTLEHTLCCLAI
jgi:hypothetical protein